MQTATLVNEELGLSYEFEVTGGVISAVVGPWPVDGHDEVVLHGELPPHGPAENVPERLRTEAREQGLVVCYYDPVHCRTCYCDENGRTVRCVGHC